MGSGREEAAMLALLQPMTLLVARHVRFCLALLWTKVITTRNSVIAKLSILPLRSSARTKERSPWIRGSTALHSEHLTGLISTPHFDRRAISCQHLLLGTTAGTTLLILPIHAARASTLLHSNYFRQRLKNYVQGVPANPLGCRAPKTFPVNLRPRGWLEQRCPGIKNCDFHLHFKVPASRSAII